MDEPISMKSGIALDAAGVTFTGSTDDRVAQAVIAEDCTNFALYNLNLTAGCYEYGILYYQKQYIYNRKLYHFQ